MSDLPNDTREHPSRDLPDATQHHWGTVASTADAATRGRQSYPMTEPMPVSPQISPNADWDKGSWK